MSSVTNLAQNLTDTTRAHGGRVAVRVDNAAMSYRALASSSSWYVSTSSSTRTAGRPA